MSYNLINRIKTDITHNYDKLSGEVMSWKLPNQLAKPQVLEGTELFILYFEGAFYLEINSPEIRSNSFFLTTQVNSILYCLYEILGDIEYSNDLDTFVLRTQKTSDGVCCICYQPSKNKTVCCRMNNLCSACIRKMTQESDIFRCPLCREFLSLI